MNGFQNKTRPSLIHQLDPRVRVVTAFAFAAVVVSCNRLPVLAAALAMSLALVIAARLGPAQILRRLTEPNLFMLMMVVFLPPFVPGERAFRVGPVEWSRQGLAMAGLIALRANTIIIALAALLGTMEPARLGHALSRLGCPRKLVHVLLFMVRYLDVVQREYGRLTNAMKCRGFRPGFNRHTFRTLGYLTGQLLVRSIERCDRIAAAMKCRGFCGRLYVLAPLRVRAPDALFAAVAIAGTLLLGWMEIG